MGQEGERDGPGPVWERALERFDRDLNARGMSPNTRRAYGVDLDQFAAWANDRGLSPEAIAERIPIARRWKAALRLLTAARERAVMP